MNSNRWAFEQVGLGYHCGSEEIQTHLYLTRIRRSRGDLTGELKVTTNIEGVKTQSGDVLHTAKLNVDSSTSRSSMAKTLGARTAAAKQDVDWFDALEALCQGVMLAEQEGQPALEIGLAAPRSPKDKFLVEPLVLKGQTSIIFGPGGSGKSMIALACGLSVATHREIIPGVAPAVHGNVLYLDWETEYDEINDRIQAIAAGHKFTPEGMFYRQCRRPLADEVEKISEVVAEKKIVLVIVDSAAFAMGTQGEYGDSNESTIRMYTSLRLLGTSNHVVDHVNRTDARAKPGKSSPYGSIYKDNAARNNWELRKLLVNGTMKVGLYHHKPNNTATLPSFGLELVWTDGAVVFRQASLPGDDEEGFDEAENTAAAIKEIIADGPATLSTLAGYFPKEKYNTIKGTARRMVIRGELIRHDETGMFDFPTPAKLRTLPGYRGVEE